MRTVSPVLCVGGGGVVAGGGGRLPVRDAGVEFGGRALSRGLSFSFGFCVSGSDLWLQVAADPNPVSVYSGLFLQRPECALTRFTLPLPHLHRGFLTSPTNSLSHTGRLRLLPEGSRLLQGGFGTLYMCRDRWTGAGASVGIVIYFYLRKVELVCVGRHGGATRGAAAPKLLVFPTFLKKSPILRRRKGAGRHGPKQ